MDCMICRELQRRLQTELSEYTGARASAYYQVSKKLAARKNVDMERARFEFEEHRRTCVLTLSVIPLLPILGASRRLAA